MMHNLDLGTAFLYWIPAISILLIMTVFLSFSFLRYRLKKERGRQGQRDYLELDLSTRRPRIGALSCHTHDHHWTELMQSFPVNQLRNILKEYQVEHQQQFETLVEESGRSSAAGDNKDIVYYQNYNKDKYQSSFKGNCPPSGDADERRNDKILSKNVHLCNSHSLIDEQKVISSREPNAKENNTRENPYYDQSLTVANDSKTRERRHRKHKKRKLLSFATSKDRESKECLAELKIPNTNIISPVSLSPVHYNTNKDTTKPAFTVDINNLQNTHHGSLVPHGVYPSHSGGDLGGQNFSPTNQRNAGYWKPHVEEHEIHSQRVKSDPEERWRSSSDENKERLFWVSSCDIAQTPV